MPLCLLPLPIPKEFEKEMSFLYDGPFLTA